jgi:hypothetical protein
MKLPTAEQQQENANCESCGEMHRLYTELLEPKLQPKTNNRTVILGFVGPKKPSHSLGTREQFSFTLAHSMRRLGTARAIRLEFC